jgi:hypothetical protein
MLRAILAALFVCVASPAFAFLQGPWNVAAQHGTIKGYAKASSSRSCLTADTRAVLARLEARVGAVSIVSTCRPGATIAGTGRPSFHRYGKAVDFNTRKKAAAISFLRTQGVFVMTYCGMSHVHFNTGQVGTSFCGARHAYALARKRGRR